ncbi:hypothetical protein ACLOJK_027333 [Asimina triloba]
MMDGENVVSGGIHEDVLVEMVEVRVVSVDTEDDLGLGVIDGEVIAFGEEGCLLHHQLHLLLVAKAFFHYLVHPI